MIRNRIDQIYKKYPKNFWILTGASFIDRLGGAIIFPYIALYTTKKFDVGMTQVGTLFAIFSITSLFGSMLGGALTDRYGRKLLVILGLILSASSSLSMGFVNNIHQFYLLGAFVGLFINLGGPAQMAMVADLLPDKQTTEGFGVLRVVANLAVTVGPAIGGFLAAKSYMMLFIADASMSILTAAVVLRFLPETRKETSDEEQQNLRETISGYFVVLKNKLFMSFIGVSMLVFIVYMQLSGALPVYLRDIHSVDPKGYGYLLSFNALLVVLLQFAITRKTSTKPPMIMMALGSLFYLVGYTLFGFLDQYALFYVAIAILTIGEMIVNPVAQSLASRFAPEDMRGRYMAVFELSFTIPSAIGPLLAGLIMDNHDPNWVWYSCGILCFFAIGGFIYLHNRTPKRYNI